MFSFGDRCAAFANATLHAHPSNGRLYYRTRVRFTDVGLIAPLCQELRRRQALDCRFALRLRDYSLRTSGPNETTFRLSCYFEYEPLCLREVIKRQTRPLNSAELVRLLYHATEAGAAAERLGVAHGSLSLDAVLFSAGEGIYRIAQPPLSEIVRCVALRSQNPINAETESRRKSKGDVSRLALVLLSCGLGIETVGMSPRRFQPLLQRFCARFGRNVLLCSAVRAMLGEGNTSPLGFVRLLKCLPPHADIDKHLNDWNAREQSPLADGLSTVKKENSAPKQRPFGQSRAFPLPDDSDEEYRLRIDDASPCQDRCTLPTRNISFGPARQFFSDSEAAEESGERPSHRKAKSIPNFTALTASRATSTRTPPSNVRAITAEREEALFY